MRSIISVYLFFGVILASFFTTYLLSRGRAYYPKVLSALGFCVSVYLLGYLLEINSVSLDQMVFWNQIQYLTLPFFPVLWLVVALLYTKRIYVLRKMTIPLLFFIPGLTLVLRATNSLHHLFYNTIYVTETAGSSLLYLGKGPWYYVHSIYVLICLIATSVIFDGEYKNSGHADQRRFRILLAASLIPYTGLVLNIANVFSVNIDYTALFMPFSLFLVLFAISRYDFLEVRLLARETIFENSSDAMLLLDTDYRLLDYNEAAKRLFSINKRLQNRRVDDVLADSSKLVDLFKRESDQHFELNHNGDTKFYEINSTNLTDHYGKRIAILKLVRDITEEQKIRDKLEELATIDELSGIYNRRQFMQLANRDFERSKRYHQELSVLMIDIDDFKDTNDTFGHSAGDAVIQELGILIRTSFRKADVCGRIGGEEFAVLLNHTALEQADLVAEQFRRSVEAITISHKGESLGLTISIGIASLGDDTKSMDDLLKNADEALYQSKKRGKNCITTRERIAL